MFRRSTAVFRRSSFRSCGWFRPQQGRRKWFCRWIPKNCGTRWGSWGCPGGWLEQMTVSELGRLFSRQSYHIKDPVDFCLKILLGDSSSSSPHKKILLVCFSLLPSCIFTFRSSDSNSIFQFFSWPQFPDKVQRHKQLPPLAFHRNLVPTAGLGRQSARCSMAGGSSWHMVGAPWISRC